ncbi:MAG TPA: succinate dehydrogenase [Hyphomicrobiaceae bacterium]|nr:succinate dehydrogenase [Hyphomicrobiaceae bacterium]
MNVRLYVLQRLTATAMVPLIAIHLATMIYAIRGGLTATEILSRTRGSVGWALFYGLFIMLAAVHGAIGVRGVLREWSRLDARALDLVMWGVGLILVLLGLRAVAAVVLP